MTGPTAPGRSPNLPDLFGDLRDGLDQAAACVDAVAAGVDAALRLLPEGSAVDGARGGVAQLRRSFADTVAWVHEALARGGDVDALHATAAEWTAGVGGPVSRLAGLSTANTARVDDHWTGVAADAYRNTLPAQQAALVACAAAATEIDGALVELAGAITRFWVDLTVACATMVAALFAAAAAAATGLGAPAALAVAATALGVFTAFAGSAASALAAVATTAAARAADLDGRLHADAAFPLGAWPRSTTDLGDGALDDGDDTDWHLRGVG